MPNFLQLKAAHARMVGEPLDADGRRWPIIIQEAGPWRKSDASGMLLYTDPEALASATRGGLFEGAKSYLNHETDAEARERPERDQGAVIGVITETRFDPSVGTLGAAVGVLNILDDTVRQRTLNAHELGVLDRSGSFSITAFGETETRTIGGQDFAVIHAFDMEAGASVDFVTEPAAGGRFLTRLAASLARASHGGMPMDWAAFVEAKPALAAAILRAESDDQARELISAFEIENADTLTTEALAARKAAEQAATTTTTETPTAGETTTTEPVAETVVTETAPVVDEQAVAAAIDRKVDQRMQKLEAAQAHKANVEKHLDGVPEKFQAAARLALEAASVGTDLSKIAAPFKTFDDSFPGGGSTVEAGADSWDKYVAAIDGFFARRDQKAGDTKVPRFRNFAEVVHHHPSNRERQMPTATELAAAMRGSAGYIGTGRGSTVLRAAGRQKLQASVTTSTHAEVFADRAHKRMAMLWHSSNMVSEVETLASNVTEYEDFKSHRIILLGEYANPGSVSEGGTYLTASTPTDLEETNSLTKYGFIDDISFEALTDPDGQKLARLPDRMIQATLRLTRQTLLNTVTTTNPTLNQDSTTLYHANHSNTGTTALTVSGINVVRAAMRQNTAQTSSAQIGGVAEPYAIIVPPELLSLAERITNPSEAYAYGLTPAATTPGANIDTDANLDPHMWRGRIRTVVADHATNATDWYTVANPALMETFEIAYLRGVREPEFFVLEDGDTAFDSDTIKWKVRYFFGATPIEYRAFYRQDVA